MAKTRVLTVSLLSVLAFATLVFIGCTDQESTERIERDGARIVSLSPALTQMVKDLGLGDKLVGVGMYDPAIDAGDLSDVGNLYQIHYERLLTLEPTIVLLQPERSAGVPNRLKQLSDRLGWEIGAFHIDTIEDALRVLHNEEDPAGSVAFR